MRSLFETLPVNGEQLTLLYRASTDQEILFREELEQIARHRGATLITLAGPSSEARNSITAQSLTAMIPDLHTRDVFICASPRFSTAIKAALASAGHPSRLLHQEDFTF